MLTPRSLPTDSGSRTRWPTSLTGGSMRLRTFPTSLLVMACLAASVSPLEAQCEADGDVEFVCGPVSPRGPGPRAAVALASRLGHGGRRLPLCDRYARSHFERALSYADGSTTPRPRDLRLMPGTRDRRLQTARSEPAAGRQYNAHALRGAPRRARSHRSLRSRCRCGVAEARVGRMCGRARGR